MLTKQLLIMCWLRLILPLATSTALLLQRMLVINDGWHKLMTDRFGVDRADAAKDITWDLHQDANKALPENRERIYIFTGSELLTEDGASLKVQTMRQAVPFWGGAGKIMTPSGVVGMSDAKIGTTIGKGKVEIDQVTKYGRGIGRHRATPYIQYDIWDDPKDQRHNESNWMTMEELVYNHPNLKADGDVIMAKTYKNTAPMVVFYVPTLFVRGTTGHIINCMLPTHRLLNQQEDTATGMFTVWPKPTCYVLKLTGGKEVLQKLPPM
jgi:hypothetical protein